ncbi:MAG: shikimate kinase [Myxococcota bacterium]|nr:shikimate kinase [Myxococcota bacterium]
MGAGKTTVGVSLARELDLPFVDLDQTIETRESLTIAALFQQGGEQAFRQAEVNALKAVVAGPPVVLACGGGAPCEPGNWEMLEAWSTVVFLDVPLDVIADRLKGQSGRPLWDGDASSRYERRLPLYARAQVRVDGSGEVASVVGLVLDALERVDA